MADLVKMGLSRGEAEMAAHHKLLCRGQTGMADLVKMGLSREEAEMAKQHQVGWKKTHHGCKFYQTKKRRIKFNKLIKR